MAVDAGEEEAAAAEGRGRGRGVTTAEQEEADMERFLQVRWWLVSVCVLLSGCDLHETEEGEAEVERWRSLLAQQCPVTTSPYPRFVVGWCVRCSSARRARFAVPCPPC